MTNSKNIRKQIVKIIQDCLKPHGFRRKTSTWYLERPEAILLLNLQGSAFGGRFYINLAVWLKALGRTSFPRHYQCHIQERLCSLSGKKLEEALKFDESTVVISECNQNVIKEALTRKALPFLERCSTHAGVKGMIQRSELKGALIFHKVYDLLGIEE